MKTGDIYYIHFPFHLDSTRPLHPAVVNETALARNKRPSIIYIDGSEKIDLTILSSHSEFHKLRKTGLEFYLFEWLRYSPKNGAWNRSFYHECRYDSAIHENLRSRLLDYLKDFSLKHGIQINVNACEYNISTHYQKFYEPLKLRCFDIQNQIECLGLDLQSRSIPQKNNISYKFWCGTNRYTTYRHIIMSYLADKPGRYSWRFFCKHLCDDIDFLSNLPWKKLNVGNAILNTTDWYIDQQTEKCMVDDYKSFNSANFIINDSASGSADFQKSLFDSFVAIVNETVCFQPTAIITEKTLNPMFSMTPFVMVGAPFTLEYLRRLNFKTFSEWWDESYDSETDHEKRLLKIFKIIDYINSKSIDELAVIYNQMISVLEWNREHVCNFYKLDNILP